MFKWTDIIVVKEMEEVEHVVENIQVDVGSLEKGLHDVKVEIKTLACEARTCKAVANSFGNKIQAIKALAERYRTETSYIATKI